MPDDSERILRRLIGGDPTAGPLLLDRATTSTAPPELVAAALLTERPAELLARAAAHATTTRDRQLVALAAAHLGGDDERFDVLVHDHLADHPDSVVAAWISAIHRSIRPQHPRGATMSHLASTPRSTDGPPRSAP